MASEATVDPQPATGVFATFGGDWDDVAAEVLESEAERLVINMGPQHPSTHGVLRLVLTLDGETVEEARLGIGYLHTGIEKSMEFRTWTQAVTFCTRMDYLAPIFNETAYCLAVEGLLGIADRIPERAQVLRVLTMELNRISSHLVAIATFGLELGATTVMTNGFLERERVLDLLEMIRGVRMNHGYVRPGGVAQDLPTGGISQIRETLPLLRRGIGRLARLLRPGDRRANSAAAARTAAAERAELLLPPPVMDGAEVRRVMSMFPSVVSVVTAFDEQGAPRGLTCSAFCSLSMEPSSPTSPPVRTPSSSAWWSTAASIHGPKTDGAPIMRPLVYWRRSYGSWAGAVNASCGSAPTGSTGGVPGGR